MPNSKLKLAFYWGAGCGGCDMAVLEIAEHMLDLKEIADIVFWPCIMDFKYEDIKNFEDGFIDACFMNGGIRNSESLEIAKLLRKKSKLLIAYGTCSCMGGIPALANLYSRDDLIKRVYMQTESTANAECVFPVESCEVKEGTLNIPRFFERVYRLSDSVEIDYQIPGCPPTGEQTWNCIEAIESNKLPEKGSVIGAGSRSVCDECPFEKKVECKIDKFKRVHEVKPDLSPKADLKDKPQCLLEQGFICMGPATRDGCGALCLHANMPCRGCYGPNSHVTDQGAKMISAIGSLVDTQGDEERTKNIMDGILDPVGTFYRFGMSNSVLKKAKVKI